MLPDNALTNIYMHCVFCRGCALQTHTGLRGQGADVIILEEAAFMSPEVLRVAVMPLMAVGNVAVLAISTPDDEMNHYSEMVDMKKPNGDPWFNVIKIGMMCEACLTAEIRCVHRKSKLPHWRPSNRNDLVMAMMGNAALAGREMGGQVLAIGQLVFKKKWVDAWVSRSSWQPRYPVQVIHVAIDPSGGSSRTSDYAVCSLAFEEGQIIVSSSRLCRCSSCVQRSTRLNARGSGTCHRWGTNSHRVATPV